MSGMEIGDKCNQNNCQGILISTKVENCSCHLSAPCNQCTSTETYCPECERN